MGVVAGEVVPVADGVGTAAAAETEAPGTALAGGAAGRGPA